MEEELLEPDLAVQPPARRPPRPVPAPSPAPAPSPSATSDALDEATADLIESRPGPGPAAHISERVGQGELDNERLAHSAVLEQMAHGGGYNDGRVARAEDDNPDDPSQGQDRRDMLERNGYSTEPQVIRGANGMQMVVYEPTREGVPPVVAFRGSEEVDDVITDVDPAQVGNEQYEANQELIDKHMAELSERYGDVELTGHSLGGALAQTTAARHLEQTQSITTFQAPGVSEEEIERIEAYNREHPDDPILADHFRVEGDVVSGAGEAHAPGMVHEMDLDRSDGNVAADALAAGGHPIAAAGLALATALDPDLPGGLDLDTNPVAAHTASPVTAMALRTGEGRAALGPEFSEHADRWTDDVATLNSHEEENPDPGLNEAVRVGVGRGLQNVRDNGHQVVDAGGGLVQGGFDSGRQVVDLGIDQAQDAAGRVVAIEDAVIDTAQGVGGGAVDLANGGVDLAQRAVEIAPGGRAVNQAIDSGQQTVNRALHQGSNTVDRAQQSAGEVIASGQSAVDGVQRRAARAGTNLIHQGEEAVHRRWAEVWGALG